MNLALAEWNQADELAARYAMMACCGAQRWADAMVALRPIDNIEELSAAADHIWSKMGEADWLQAFACHPRIGEQKGVSAAVQSTVWSRQEQLSASTASERILSELAEDNLVYVQRFGFTYIVCATGKTADEMLANLKCRLANNRSAELREAAEQQRQILQIRLGKWLAE
jgi:OHCU decarboxylase